MNSGKKGLVIFTGQSGIKVENCIRKLARTGLNYQLVSVDKAIPEISGSEFVEVLGTPPNIQNLLWTQAYEQIEDILQQDSTKHDFTFLTFHACYYHQKKTEFVCPANLNQLMLLKDRAKLIIVLIDDCYDIYIRLMDKNQMYEDVLNSGDSLNTLVESIYNITNLLTWRETEIAFSRKIAQLLNIPMYVISVNHPHFMISRLISNPRESLKILYLSHPISVIRRQAIFTRLSEFYSELSSFIKNVLQTDNVVLFVPDTIDECRIKQEKQGNNGSDLYLPELTHGWPLTFSDQLLREPLPSKLESINALNPTKYKYSTATTDAKSAISASLRILDKKIRNQINSRDLTLVEQSKDGVLVYRPYFAASTHSGVEEEMIYNCDLRDRYDERERKTYIITTKEDLGKLRIQKLFTLIEDSVKLPDTANHKNIKDNLQALCKEWLSNPTKVLEFYSKNFSVDDTREAIEKVLPAGYTFIKDVIDKKSSALATAKMLLKAEQKKRGWAEILTQVAEEDPLVKYSSEKDILLSSSDSYDKEVKTFIREVIANKSAKDESGGA